jgi:hypothetical protein
VWWYKDIVNDGDGQKRYGKKEENRNTRVFEGRGRQDFMVPAQPIRLDI